MEICVNFGVCGRESSCCIPVYLINCIGKRGDNKAIYDNVHHTDLF